MEKMGRTEEKPEEKQMRKAGMTEKPVGEADSEKTKVPLRRGREIIGDRRKRRRA